MRSPFRSAILFLATGVLCQCAHLVQEREDYRVTGEEPLVNGARLTAELLTTDGMVNYSLAAMIYVAASETETGPYKCLLTAWGERDLHRSMTVHRLVFRTANGQTIPAPPSGKLEFAPGAGGQGWQATYVVPGVLPFDYEKDGVVTLEAVVSIGSKQRERRRTIQLTLSPTPARDVRFVSVLEDFKQDDEPSKF